MSTPVELPPVSLLSYWQYKGWDCVWCATRLTTGAVCAGIALGDSGAHSLDTEVYACPTCAYINGLTQTPPTPTGDAS